MAEEFKVTAKLDERTGGNWVVEVWRRHYERYHEPRPWACILSQEIPLFESRIDPTERFRQVMRSLA